MRWRPALFSNLILINGDNLRLFEFLAKPYSVTYAKVRALVRTCQETSKIHQILAVLGELNIKNSDFLELGDPAGYCVPVGRRSKRAKDRQTIEMSLFGQKRDLRRNSRHC